MSTDGNLQLGVLPDLLVQPEQRIAVRIGKLVDPLQLAYLTAALEFAE